MSLWQSDYIGARIVQAIVGTVVACIVMVLVGLGLIWIVIRAADWIVKGV